MDDSTYSKRRRGLGVVTPNACKECRKKRAKCDGQRPCARCSSQKVECNYELPVRQSKENMRAEIEQLRRQQQQSERIFAALASNDRPENIIEQLRTGETLENISERLDIGKGKAPASSSMSNSEENTNVTAYAQLGSHQPIRNDLGPVRSIGSSPFSSVAFSDAYGDALQAQHLQDSDSWTKWGAEASSSRQIQNPNQPEAMMRWTLETPSAAQSVQSYPMIGAWQEEAGAHTTPYSTIQWARGQGKEHLLGREFGVEEQSFNSPNYNESWTKVTSDAVLVEHLMALYFCWEYPTFASLSKEHFLEDFRMGNRRHCSSLLVNAMLAVGCRFSTQANARVDPDDSNTAGDHFFAEALNLLRQEKDHHRLTTIQALGLMSIREASCGRSSESLHHSGQSIRIAVEMGLHLESESGGGDEASTEHAVKSATFWGAFSLDQAWSICIGRLPHFSKDTKLMTKPAIVDRDERSSWVPYTDKGDTTKDLPEYRNLTADPAAPLERNFTQPSNVRTVYKTFCELSEIVHKSLYVFYTPGNQLTSKSLLSIYTEYLSWYDTIPEALRLGQNFTPSVLFAHMYYHFAILLLFRPFIKLDIIGSGVCPRDVCIQAAEAVSALVKSYSQLYTLQRTPSFVPYFVLTSSITHLISVGSARGGPEHLHQGIADLKAMSLCHGFASRACDILIFLAHQWEVELMLDPEPGTKKDPKMLGRPRSSSTNFFSPNIQSGDILNGMKSGALSNESPLFWPFLLQGRPLLGNGELLKQAGFRIRPPDSSSGVVGMSG